MEDIINPPHYARLLIVPISKAFSYFSDIESYPIIYPNFCKRIDIIERSENTIVTKEFWNISINNKIDHVVLYVHYTLSFPRKSTIIL